MKRLPCTVNIGVFCKTLGLLTGVETRFNVIVITVGPVLLYTICGKMGTSLVNHNVKERAFIISGPNYVGGIRERGSG